MLTVDEMAEVVKEWREDLQEDGKRPKQQYPDLASIPFSHFDPVCDKLNAYWKAKGSGLRIYYSMGDFRPSFQSQMELGLS